MKFAELSNEQRRQLIDAQQTFAAWRPAADELNRLGTLRWQTSKGRRYLYEIHEVRGDVRKSLGRETAALVQLKKEHDDRRKQLQTREKTLASRLSRMAAVNRALGLGRVPTIAARILRELDRENLLGSHIIVVGTNALYAYEVATGTVLGGEHVATTDADLLWDTSQSLLLASTGVRRDGILGLLRRVDRSFHADYGLTVANRDGYAVDLLCAETDDFQIMRAGSDLEAQPVIGAQWLLRAPQFEQIAIGEDGAPVRMIVPEPRTFALHKLWVSRRADRQALKRPRDAAHAGLIAELVRTYLRYPFTVKDMPWLSPELKFALKELREHRKQGARKT